MRLRWDSGEGTARQAGMWLVPIFTALHEPGFRNDGSPAAGIAPHLSLDAGSAGHVGRALEADYEFTVADGFGGDREGKEIAHALRHLEVAGQHAVAGLDSFGALVHEAAIAVLVPRTHQGEANAIGRPGVEAAIVEGHPPVLILGVVHGALAGAIALRQHV